MITQLEHCDTWKNSDNFLFSIILFQSFFCINMRQLNFCRFLPTHEVARPCHWKFLKIGTERGFSQ